MRLFIALSVPDAARQRLAQMQRLVDELDLPLRTTRPEGLHLTLVFLGETREERVPEIRAAMDAAAETVGPFPIALGELGVFPNLRGPRVLWAGLSGAVSALALLHTRLAERLGARGFAIEERAFRPHVTLARTRGEWSPAKLTALRELLSSNAAARESWQAGEVHLVESRLHAEGAQYVTLYTSALKG
ncbi:MAG TPA: RNA 2',3'-cyclic phosphodiesterase [Chloroflexota bacterium]|nr:RNA 2',3'-cyclic phosphodiesterase [Chloroflexota bacterium]